MSDDPVARFLAAVESGAMESCDALAPEVTVDATVPNWRFSLRGDAAVRAEFGRWYADPGEFEEVHRTPVAGGEVVDFTLTWEEQGVPHAAHQIHVLRIDGGRIVNDKVWCGGRWPAGLLAEMAAADV